VTLTGVRKFEESGLAHAAPPDFAHLPPVGPRFPLFDRLLTCMVSAGQGMQALCLLLSLSRSVLEDHIIRLGIASPHDRAMRAGGPKAWSLKDTLRLIVWRLAAVHPEVIGQRLDTPRSANAVRAKARRLGIPSPGREALHKPDASSLREPEASDITATIMLAATEPGQNADEALKRLRERVTGAPGFPVALPVKGARSSRKQGKPDGQREFRFFSIVGDPSDEPLVKPEKPVAPSHEEQVNFEQPLTWFATLKGRRKAQANRAAAWVAFMLIAGGLHYKKAAELLGVTPASFRTFKSRIAMPSDTDRRKMGNVFNLEAAKATLNRSGYELRSCLKSGNWFWEKKTSRGVRLSPQFRTTEKIIGERGNKFTIVTRAVLEAENRVRYVPFAKMADRLSA
jgi:hypothetical protein